MPSGGWGPKELRLKAQRYYQMRGRHHNIYLLIDQENTVTSVDCFPGKSTADDVENFFESCLAVFARSSIRYIQMDGARIHNLQVALKIRSLTNRHGENLIPVRQPPYCPHYNPVEPANGLLKTFLKKDPLFAGNNVDAIREQVVRAVEKFTPEYLRAFYRYCHF